LDLESSNWRELNIYMGIPFGIILSLLIYFTVYEKEQNKNLNNLNKNVYKIEKKNSISILESLKYVFTNFSLILIFLAAGIQTFVGKIITY
jgi:hypothetical protein